MFDKPYYITTQIPGTGSHFIESLLIIICDNVDNIIEFGSNGNSHPFVKIWNENNTNFFQLEKTRFFYENLELDPNSPSDFLVCDSREHYYHKFIILNYDKLYSKYPNFKHIALTSSRVDQVRLLANRYYKSEKNFDYETYWKYYLDLCQTDTDIAKDVTHLDQLSVNDMRLLFEYRVDKSFQPWEPLLEDNWQICRNYVPKQYQSKLYQIKYNDILNNKELVLNTLSEITNKDITVNTRRNYDRYLELQAELVEKFIPWAQQGE